MTTPWQKRIFADPVVYPDNATFWQPASEGQLLHKRCIDFSEVHWNPRPICPFCGSDRNEWIPALREGHRLFGQRDSQVWACRLCTCLCHA